MGAALDVNEITQCINTSLLQPMYVCVTKCHDRAAMKLTWESAVVWAEATNVLAGSAVKQARHVVYGMSLAAALTPYRIRCSMVHSSLQCMSHQVVPQQYVSINEIIIVHLLRHQLLSSW